MKNKIILTLATALLVCNTANSAPAPAQKITATKPAPKMEVKVESNTYSPNSSVIKMLEYGNNANAEVKINSLLKSNPNDINARSLQIISKVKKKSLDSAQADINKYMKTAPQNANLHYAQGLLYLARLNSSNMDYQANKAELINSAKEQFTLATLLDQKHFAAYNYIGLCELKLNNLDKAKEMFLKSISIDSQFATALDNLGTVDYLNNDLNEAELKFKKSVKINPRNASAYFHLAQLANKRQDYSQALTYLNNAQCINSNSSSIFNLFGEIYRNQGNEAAAIQAFKKASAIAPENIQPYLNLAEIYEKRSDSEFAIEQLKTVSVTNPNLYDAKLKIADISYSTGKYDQALKYYTSLIGVKKYNEEALKGVSNTYFELAKVVSSKNIIGSTQNFTKALDKVNKAIAANPRDLELYLAKIKLMNVSNQKYNQKELLSQLVSFPVKNTNDMVTKGEAYFVLDDIQHSNEMFDLAVNNTKTLKDDLYLGEILTYHKHYAPAKQALRKALSKDADNKIALSNFEYILKTENRSNAILKDANVFFEKKNYILAREYAIRALNFNPSNVDALLLLAKASEKDKNYYNAIYNYQKYLAYPHKKFEVRKINRKIKKLEKKLR